MYLCLCCRCTLFPAGEAEGAYCFHVSFRVTWLHVWVGWGVFCCCVNQGFLAKGNNASFGLAVIVCKSPRFEKRVQIKWNMPKESVIYFLMISPTVPTIKLKFVNFS